MSEIEAFPRAVLQHHYPNTPLHGDFTTIQADQYDSIDVLVGGTPCQSFSVAGLRGGMADERGNLALEYLRLAERLRPRWSVWENVPGILSSGDGRDFGSFLGGLAELGYGWAYRVLDAQYFGLAQRRKRVFVVGYLGDWRRAVSVLFEPASLRGHSPPSREARERVASAPNAGSDTGGRKYGLCADTDDSLISMSLNAKGGSGRGDGESETFVCFDINQVTSKANYSNPQPGDPSHPLVSAAPPMIAHALRAKGYYGSEDGTGRGTPLVPWGTWQGGSNQDQLCHPDSISPTLCHWSGENGHNGHSQPKIVDRFDASSVRRLTPRECERLQGFPDDYTLVNNRGKPAADGPRYRALGNSFAVPVVRWIGRRIQMIDDQR